jgi:hypothetical protein
MSMYSKNDVIVSTSDVNLSLLFNILPKNINVEDFLIILLFSKQITITKNIINHEKSFL